ncbi:MAG: HlyD family efflux transporter periplasmic adaptor subunit [Armatimonadetes bacterium]|nr:HlyD family efflux transporter periplasmic adaptor subunit [Armatimonadota bacterium]
MNKWAIGIGAAVLIGVATWVVVNGSQSTSEIEYRYSTVGKGELVRSTSATGTLVPLTKVDVKSKAGGKVVKLLVEEGSPVRQGDVIAIIDPEDTKTAFEQAAADVTTAGARVSQAQVNARMEEKNASDRVRDAEVALALARSQYAKAQQTATAQPTLTQADIKTAEANLTSAEENLKLVQDVQVLQTRRDVQGTYDRSKADLEAAQAEMTRQERLLELGYVSQSAVEKQRTVVESARAAFRLAEQRRATVQAEIETQLRTARARVQQAEQSLRQSRTNANRNVLTQRDLDIARQNVRGAEIALSQARTAKMNISLRRSDVASARASAVRSEVALRNARVQLDSTTVLAPRDGIVTTKYLEEGTIIPPGTSTFAQGTSLVQIADTTQMEVECLVDEADIASVRVGQPVRIIVEAYPGQTFDGSVKRIFPAADTAQSVTTVKVRVTVKGPSKSSGDVRNGGGPEGRGEGGGKPSGKSESVLRPGMNATCEFIQLDKQAVLTVPQPAILREGGETYVRVKTGDPKKPEKRPVKLGAVGNESIEVVDGLKEGEEVVVAEVDLRAMRDRQTKMQQQQQGGGGLGSLNKGGPSSSRASGASKGGGK